MDVLGIDQSLVGWWGLSYEHCHIPKFFQILECEMKIKYILVCLSWLKFHKELELLGYIKISQIDDTLVYDTKQPYIKKKS
jgi:hypothetical protein